MPATIMDGLPYTNNGKEENKMDITVYLKSKEVVLSFSHASLITDAVEVRESALAAGCNEVEAAECIEAISEGEWGPTEKDKIESKQ